MSYGVLRHGKILTAFTEGWKARRKKVFSDWQRGSARMLNAPVLQACVLHAVGSRQEVLNNSEALRTCLAIEEMNRKFLPDDSHDEFGQVVRSRLIATGLFSNL